MARYDERKVAALLENAGIVRNRLKVNAAVTNAKAFLAVQKEFGTLRHVHLAIRRRPPGAELAGWTRCRPVRSRADAMSKDLKSRGFRFVGSTICYAFMQATGMVNDHVVDCFRHAELS